MMRVLGGGFGVGYEGISLAIKRTVLRGLVDRYPLLPPCFGGIVGILLAGYCQEPPAVFGTVLPVGFLLGYLGSRSWRRSVCLMLGCLTLAWLRTITLITTPVPKIMESWIQDRSWVQAELQVEEYAVCESRFCRFRGQLLAYFAGDTRHPLRVGLQVKVRDATIFVIPGEIYRLPLRLSAPKGFRNPESFDYPRYLRNQGVFALAQADLRKPWKRLRPATWFYRQAGKLRVFLRGQLALAIPDGPVRGVLAALLLGDSAWLDPSTAEAFRRCGLTHVLVVSGLHFTFVLLCCYAPLYLLLSLRSAWADSGAARRWALGLAWIPTWFYGLLVGLTPSVLRGLGGGAILIFSVALRWRRNFTSSLLLVATTLLAIHPLWLFSLSFQLSFLSVAAVYYFGRPFLKLLGARSTESGSWLGRLLIWLGTAFYSTVVANLVLFPLLAQSFHEVSLIAPFANLLLVPFFASFLLPAELAAAGLSGVSAGMGQVAFAVLGKILQAGMKVVDSLAKFPHATALVGPLSPFSWLAYLLGLMALLLLRRPKYVVRCSLAALLCLSGGWLQRHLTVPPKLLSLTMVDVGQGDGLFLQLPNGEMMVIDGGGFPGSDFDVGRNVLLPELLGRGIRRLTAVALTHPDADHWKGLRFLAERYSVGEFWVSAGISEHPDFATLKHILHSRSIPLRVLSRGASWDYQGVRFEVLWPPKLGMGTLNSDNDRSLVLRVCYGEVCLLLTGDIEAEAESELLRDVEARPAAVLKLAHHGSKTSSTLSFLKADHPRIALISAGQGNRYGFPNSGVLDRLAALGIPVLRTDRQGQLLVQTDGREIFYRSFTDEPIPSWWSSSLKALFGSGS